jgi:hypothetical protein
MTYLSPPQPARSVAVTGATQDLRRSGNRSQFAAGRVYEIARLETASEPRGEWRAVGESIHEHGSQIEFTELGSGKPISFIAPHQVTETDSHSDRRVTQFRHEGPEDDRYTSAPR